MRTHRVLVALIALLFMSQMTARSQESKKESPKLQGIWISPLKKDGKTEVQFNFNFRTEKFFELEVLVLGTGMKMKTAQNGSYTIEEKDGKKYLLLSLTGSSKTIYRVRCELDGDKLSLEPEKKIVIVDPAGDVTIDVKGELKRMKKD